MTQSQLATKNTEHAEALEQLQTDRQAAQGALQSQLAAETEKTNLERQRATELEKQAQEALTKANSEHATAQQGAQERNAALAAREQDLKTALERQTQEANTELEKLRTDHQSQLAALQQEKDAALETAQAAAQGALQNQLAEANAQQKAELEQLRGQLANANTANEAAQGALQSQLKQQQDANAVLEQQASQHATVLAEAQEAQEAADLANREKERQIIVVLRAQKAINEAARKELEMQHATALAKQKAEHDAALTQQKAALEQQAREAREAQEQLKKNTIDVGVQTGDIIGADGVVRVIVGESGDGVDGVDREPKASDPAALNTDGGRVEFNPPEGVKAIFCGKKDDEIVVVCAFDGETSKAFAEIGGSQKKNDEEKSSLLKTHRVSNPDEGVELYENNNIAKLQEKAKSEDMQSVMFKYNEKTRNLDITFNKEDAEATFSSNKFKYVISIVGDQCHMDCYNKDDDSLNPLTGEAEKEALKNIAKNNIKIFDKNDEMSFPNSAVAEPAVEALKGAGRGGGHVLG